MQRLSIIPLNGLPKYALSTMCLMMRTFYLTQRSSIQTTCTYCYILGCIHYVLYDIDFVYKTRFLKFSINICTLTQPDCTETGCFKAVLIMPQFHITVKKCISKHRKRRVLNEKKIASISIWSLSFYYFLFISQIPSF